MMECNDCLFEGWNEQTAITHIERWADKSEEETRIVRFGHIQDKQEGDKMLGDPGVSSHFLPLSSIFPFKQGKAMFRKVVEVAARNSRHIGRDAEGKCIWLGSQQAYTAARAQAGGVHLVFNPLPGIIHQDSHHQMFFDALYGMDKGVLPFTMCASMTMCVSFEESICCKGVTERRIKQRMQTMAGALY
jgi:hypothetical protein